MNDWCVLKAGPEDNTELRVVMSGMSENVAHYNARELKKTHANEGSWAPTYYVAQLEAV